jgi:hypothetical protein
MGKEHAEVATGFIENIWNGFRLDAMNDYLHSDFVDYSLPKGMQNSSCLAAYLTEIRKNIDQHTIIEKLVFEDDFVLVEVTIKLAAVPDPEDEQFRNRPDEIVEGWRILAMSNQLIIGHWEFLCLADQTCAP